MSIKRRMHLVAYLKTGPTANHAGGWRHPASDLNDIFEPERALNLVGLHESHTDRLAEFSLVSLAKRDE